MYASQLRWNDGGREKVAGRKRRRGVSFLPPPPPPAVLALSLSRLAPVSLPELVMALPDPVASQESQPHFWEERCIPSSATRTGDTLFFQRAKAAGTDVMPEERNPQRRHN